MSIEMDNDTIKTSLINLQKRALYLETSLREANKTSVVSSREFHKRQGTLRQMSERIDLLISLVSDATDQNQGTLHTPELTRCSYDELIICNYFLSERLNFIKDVYYYLGEIFKWSIDASQGKGRGLRSIWRLANMKKILQRTEHENSKLEFDEKELFEKAEQISKTMIKRGDGEHLSDNFKAFIKLFHELDALTMRITKLKAAITQEESEIKALTQQIGLMKRGADNRAPSSIPKLDEIIALSEEARNAILEPVRLNKNRLTIARHFLEGKKTKKTARKGALARLSEPTISDRSTS